MKQLIVTVIINMPVVRYYFYKYYVFRKPLNEKALRGKIQYLGHCVDLNFSDSYAVPKTKIYELKFHLREFFKSKYQVDDSVLWAIKMLLCHRHGIKPAEKLLCTVLDSDSIHKFEKIIKERRSIRKWLPENVSESDITKAIELATWAPSSCNRQPWQVLIVTKEADKVEMTKYFPNKFYAAAPVLLLVLIDSRLYGEIEKPFIYLDAGAFVQNLLLGLHVLGYGACWIGFNGWNVFDGPELHLPRSEQFYVNFRVDKKMIPISLIAVGRPAAIPNAPARQDPQNIQTYYDK
jgi:nitroreductase